MGSVWTGAVMLCLLRPDLEQLERLHREVVALLEWKGRLTGHERAKPGELSEGLRRLIPCKMGLCLCSCGKYYWPF